MTDFLWGSPGSAFNLLTTELNSLATGSGTALGPEIDNTSTKYQRMRLEFVIASNSLAFTTSSFVKVFLLPILSDATNYPNYTSGASYKLAEGNYLAGIINIIPATISSAVVRETLENVRVPQGKFKTALVSSLGVTLPSSGNTLNGIPTPDAY
jgi:hypothetical protein